jgi:hypothetical protein
MKEEECLQEKWGILILLNKNNKMDYKKIPAQNTATKLLGMLYDSPNGRTEEEILAHLEVPLNDYLHTIAPLLNSRIITRADSARKRTYKLDTETRRTMFCMETGLNLSQTAEPRSQ